MTDRTGVMPAPAAKAANTRSRPGADAMPKRPVGVITSMTSPGFSALFTQFENVPPSIRFTATRSSLSAGQVQIE